jgi:voltage-gated potassium channel Kch
MLDYSPDSPATLRSVSDLPFPKLISLVEERLGHSLADLEGWSEYLALRDTVNAFKHRAGRRKWQDVARRARTMGALSFKDAFHEAGISSARAMLKVISGLLKQLRNLEAAVESTRH